MGFLVSLIGVVLDRRKGLAIAGLVLSALLGTLILAFIGMLQCR